ncbi:MAG TPA: lipid A-modifier LpxR family protein, partial [Gemmatimonadaceae bacterium]|nr:lipid A-modifier LpxR family protein [Gemmatimonadaceae bacterium]
MACASLGAVPAAAQDGNRTTGEVEEAGAGAKKAKAATERDASSRSRARHPSTGWLPRVRLDNDAYNFWLHPGHRSDEEYTNGVVIGMEALKAPGWGRTIGRGAPACATSLDEDGACLTTSVFIGQDMYTPNLDRPPFSYAGWMYERPYAAWLYVGGEGRRVSNRALRTYALSVGVTGAP